MDFFNIHTHKHIVDTLSIINLFPDEHGKIENDNYYSIGLHPWNVSNVDINKTINIIRYKAGNSSVLAIGETGLDKYKPSFDLQKDVFILHIKIANEYNKPLIVHCVKAYSELLEILKYEPIKVPVIIHRFSGNKTIAEQLIKFDCYLSFGHELFNINSKPAKVFKNIPSENVFFETDDSDMMINDIYKKAAKIKDVEIGDLKEIIHRNFIKCFGNLFN